MLVVPVLVCSCGIAVVLGWSLFGGNHSRPRLLEDRATGLRLAQGDLSTTPPLHEIRHGVPEPEKGSVVCMSRGMHKSQYFAKLRSLFFFSRKPGFCIQLTEEKKKGPHTDTCGRVA